MCRDDIGVRRRRAWNALPRPKRALPDCVRLGGAAVGPGVEGIRSVNLNGVGLFLTWPSSWPWREHTQHRAQTLEGLWKPKLPFALGHLTPASSPSRVGEARGGTVSRPLALSPSLQIGRGWKALALFTNLCRPPGPETSGISLVPRPGGCPTDAPCPTAAPPHPSSPGPSHRQCFGALLLRVGEEVASTPNSPLSDPLGP